MIIRDEHADSFTVINNAAIEDKNISAEAFRLLVFMLSCADSWQFSLKGLAVRLDIPERTLAYRLTELKNAGYIKQTRPTDELGRFKACEWEVHETPLLSTVPKNHSVDYPQCGKTTVRKNHSEDYPQCGNVAVYKQIPNETNTNNKQIRKGARIFVKPTLEEIAQYCQERGNTVDPQKFIDHYESNGWRVGKNPMKDWRAAVRTWESNSIGETKRSGRKKWRTGSEAGITSAPEPRAPVSKINKDDSIPNDILDMFGN